MTGRTRAYASADSARAHIAGRELRPQPYGPPTRLHPDVAVEVRRRFGWPIYTVTPASGLPCGTVVYLHGGGWVNEISTQHWQLVIQAAHEAHVKVIVPIYPLVPFATAAEVMPTVVQLVAEVVASGDRVYLVGDSAGGQMALSAALLLRDEHDVVIPRTVLISPVLDLSLSNPDIAAVDDPWLGRDGLLVFADRWRGDLSLGDPRVDPLAADLRGLGALTVFSGTRDILNPDARLLVQKAGAAGVAVDYHEKPGLLHVYPLSSTPEGRAARRIIVERLRG
ncbi:esterase [Mycobacterium intermedium]|uniref:Esterase n=1 Tax=Mycobacterium intermedium TaxID=28445 RepID=A0A1E3SCW1_MYCIE|nr:alpha/beta hydrolase fold domain-containing protein [Mycobacterium intermedium]MCV6966561.1 alpha/beta hydrolase fold domain-containing protein [Mycobacterium intermedium]ODQ99921.1 esterase [Mycobacterium intermedium]OPE49803.1 esterase [Mycobacterium intermedium]ORB08270.1 esterase [Mycobacterium intermedium]